jgi:glycosyltransferase involved in cell wall biosynthesis
MMKKIAVVLPTYNRLEYLKVTLDLFVGQVSRNENSVSFWICNNASTDGTDQFLVEFNRKHPNFNIKNFTDHVDIGHSISRSNDLADGEYVLMWGDDDIPFPYMLDTLLDTLREYEKIGLVHFNRLQGFDDKVAKMSRQSLVFPHTSCNVEQFESMDTFLMEHALDITFLSAVMFKKEYWDKNKGLNTETHYGYEFLGHILHGFSKKDRIVYIPYPLMLQRKPETRPWMKDSPLYRFVGMPNMYYDFEKWGLITSAKKLWMKNGNNNRQFLSVMAQTSMFKSIYRSKYKEMIRYQFSFFRKLLAFFFIYIMPASVYKCARKSFFSR